MAHRPQGLVSVGHRDGNLPAALAEAARVVILDGIASVPSSMCSDLSGNVTRGRGLLLLNLGQELLFKVEHTI